MVTRKFALMPHNDRAILFGNIVAYVVARGSIVEWEKWNAEFSGLIDCKYINAVMLNEGASYYECTMRLIKLLIIRSSAQEIDTG